METTPFPDCVVREAEHHGKPTTRLQICQVERWPCSLSTLTRGMRFAISKKLFGFPIAPL